MIKNKQSAAIVSECYDNVSGNGTPAARQSLIQFMRDTDLPVHKTKGLPKSLILKVRSEG